jgi:hypothetical protein
VRRGRAFAAIAVLAVAVLTAGCGLFFPAGFDEDFPSSSPIATYATGSATIAIEGGDTIDLTDLANGASIDSLYGSDIRWSGPDGWHLKVTGAGADDMGFAAFGEGAYVSLDRIFDGKHWTTYDPSRCIVDIEVADKAKIKGTATCKGLEWYDALDSGFTPDGPKELGEPKFDAELTFEAIP